MGKHEVGDQKKVSLKDVAGYVGVSTALVSYVLNNKEKQGRVGAGMAAKIRDAALALNYKPNLIAQSLKSGKTNTIGLIVADISNPFFSMLARIIEDEAKKHGYVVLFGSSDESAEKSQDLIDVFLNRQVDAFIIAPASDTKDQISRLKKRKVPFVLVDRYFPDVETDSVHIDNSKAAYQAVEHLIRLQKRKIAMVCYDMKLPHFEQRRAGYIKALKAHKIVLKKDCFVEASHQNISKDIEQGLRKLLFPKAQIDAIFFATNSLAVEGLKVINAFGIKVPDQVGIISFDETEAFDFFYSPITYVSQSVSDMGREAVKLVLNRIKDNSSEYVTVVVETKLVVRSSAGEKQGLTKTRAQSKA